MAKYRVVKQMITGSATIAAHKNNRVFVAQLSGSSDKLWEFDNASDAYMKMYQLSGSDSTKRLYKVVEI